MRGDALGGRGMDGGFEGEGEGLVFLVGFVIGFGLKFRKIWRFFRRVRRAGNIRQKYS